MRTLLILSFLSACQEPAEWARAYKIDTLKETVGGPKAIARPGDFVIENDRLRFSILGPRPSMGNHTEGGSLVDADLQRLDPSYSKGHGGDQWGELFGTVNLMTSRIRADQGSVEIVSEGSSTEPAVLCTIGDGHAFISLLDFARAFLGGDIRIRTDYVLAPGAPVVQVRSFLDRSQTITCDDDLSDATPVQYTDSAVPLLDVATNDGYAFGDFTLFGGSVDVFAPTIGFDEAGHVNELTTAGVNTFVEPIVLPYLGGSSHGVSYAVMASGGALSVPMFTGSQTAAFGGFIEADQVEDGVIYRYDRWFAVGEGDIGSALDGLHEAASVSVGTVKGHVVERGSGVALSDVSVFAYKPGEDGPYVQWLTDVGQDPRADGSFEGTLPDGRWDLVVHAEGRPLSDKVPVTVTSGSTIDVVLESPQPGSVEYTLVDEFGDRIPGKVSFFRVDDTVTRRPDLGDGYIGGNPAQVSFAAHGHGQIILPPGDYYAVASRGPEYELAYSEDFRVARSSYTRLKLLLARTVDTSGWISADFHVHAMPSPDSGVTLRDRVTTFVAEGVEFMASSDHDAIIDYEPVIQQMDLEQWLSSAPGTEVTTIEIGHFLGFPLRWDPIGDKGGALDWTDLSPIEILDGIRDLGDPSVEDPLVFVAHPRDGLSGYFDQYGFDPYTGTDSAVVEPNFINESANDLISEGLFTMEFDAMEILNAKRFENIRSATTDETDALYDMPGSVSTYELLSRTAAEQAALEAGDAFLSDERPGPLDDWFTTLNLGYRVTALGNSDTHSKTKTEAGCPRNYVQVGTDDPAEITPEAVAEAVKQGRVVTSYGPFVRVGMGNWANGPGTTVVEPGEVELFIEVQSPSWFDVDRVELYENGALIHEWNLEPDHDPLLDLATRVTLTPERDSWYVVIALGEDDLSPMFTPVDIMPIQLQDIVDGAIGELSIGPFDLSSFATNGAPLPRTFPIRPFALTNPIWVDKDGDGFDPPGIPDWLERPPSEDESKSKPLNAFKVCLH